MIAAVSSGQELTFLNQLQTIGASGAIYGVLLAFGMLFPNMPLYIMFIPVPIKAKWMVIGYGAIELLIGLSSANDGVSHFSHLGVMIFGFIMILFWKKKGTLHGGF
ncbi:MAG: rhomboid family intramembrane serine protease [Paramuribaculum sp.]|nr:rhomboid family intramembrane serine protease [Paramuribaculum sp.]